MSAAFRILALAVFAFLSLPTVALATKVVIRDRACPVCEKAVAAREFASYSNWAEPARDLSNDPSIAMASVRVCPHDLYAAWEWDELGDAERAKLKQFLAKPYVRLTEAEKAAVRDNIVELKESGCWKVLFARTCCEFREADPSRDFYAALNLYHRRPSGRAPWEQKLAAIFRESAIASLESALAADWAGAPEKRMFAYLRAYLVWKSGNTEKARELFKKVLADESAAQPDPSWNAKWITDWSQESLDLMDRETVPLDELISRIHTDFPDPWRRPENAPPLAAWERHVTALRIVIDRAVAGDKPAQDKLWSLLDKRAERLLALAETVQNVSIIELTKADPRWAEWAAEIRALLEKKKLPAAFAKDPNPERIKNLLLAVLSEPTYTPAWRAANILPAVMKAAADGTKPDLKMKASTLAAELWNLMSDCAGDERRAVLKVVIRLLKDLPENGEGQADLSSALLLGINEQEIIRGELGGKWRNDFWKRMCEYIIDAPGAKESLAKHPLLKKPSSNYGGNPYESALWAVARKKKDAYWKPRIIKALESSAQPALGAEGYAMSLDDSTVERAIKERLKRLRGTDGEKTLNFEIRMLEEELANGKLRALEIAETAPPKP